MKQQPPTTIRTLVLVSAIICPLCLLPRIAAAQDVKQSGIEGIVYTVDSDGGRSVVPCALVKRVGPSFAQQTVTNDQGTYGFRPAAPHTYHTSMTPPALIAAR